VTEAEQQKAGTKPPKFQGRAYVCPSCSAHAQMDWGELWVDGDDGGFRQTKYWRATCAACRDEQVWLNDSVPGVRTRHVMITPRKLGGTEPHAAMPAAAKALYDEARAVSQDSPRAAAGLLRVAVDTLLRDVVPDAGTKSLNELIPIAKRQGLPIAVEHGLDVLRVTGNGALHPGQIDLDEEDPAGTVSSLCLLINLTVEHLVAAPQMAAEMFAALPAGIRAAIEKRDSKT
jgi:hypothetical protein